MSYQAATCLDRYVNWGHCESQAAQGTGATNGFGGTHQRVQNAGSAPFVEFQSWIRDAIEQRVFRNDVPVELISRSLSALVEATIDLTVSNPSKAAKYRGADFKCSGLA